MMNAKCCGDCDKCQCSHGSQMSQMKCCEEHKVSKEHLKMKKDMLEEKLKWVKEELAKK